MKTVIYGINGKMGSLLAQFLLKDNRFDLVYGVDPLNDSDLGEISVYNTFLENPVPDVIIDFSHHTQISTILRYASTNKVPLVIATTGYSEIDKKLIFDMSKEIPIFYSANMSYGISLIRQMLKQFTTALENDFDIEVIEKHHHHKVDAPSGTANLLINTIQEVSQKHYQIIPGRSGQTGKRTTSEIGVHALRGGSIVGEHTIVFAGVDEVIELTHKAESKAIFVHGAIKAALFIKDQNPGLYSMDDLTKK